MELQELKDYLKITWDEENTSLESVILSGQSFLEDIAGVKLNFVEDLSSKQLLKDYCRYAYNHSLEHFEVNFKRELLKMSLREAVKLREATTSDV